MVSGSIAFGAVVRQHIMAGVHGREGSFTSRPGMKENWHPTILFEECT
jgi:hypothetical protein